MSVLRLAVYIATGILAVLIAPVVAVVLTVAFVVHVLGNLRDHALERRRGGPLEAVFERVTATSCAPPPPPRPDTRGARRPRPTAPRQWEMPRGEA